MGQAGMNFDCFATLRSHAQEWIFVQLMASAQHSAGDSALVYGKGTEEAAGALFSRERARRSV
jgi:hypothetical protein